LKSTGGYQCHENREEIDKEPLDGIKKEED
jgi:hypothetical protein